jgi:hypothetical protein
MTREISLPMLLLSTNPGREILSVKSAEFRLKNELGDYGV